MARGVRAERLIPVYPTKTFPNHYTIVTGLYPAHHGIVANTMRDPERGGASSSATARRSSDGRWWGGEPIWVTAARQGRRTAHVFWPGSEAPIPACGPTGGCAMTARSRTPSASPACSPRLDLPPADAAVAHRRLFQRGGRRGARWRARIRAELRRMVTGLDEDIGRLVAGLEARRLLDRVNVVIVSDHGMAEIGGDRVIVLQRLPRPRLASRSSRWTPT